VIRTPHGGAQPAVAVLAKARIKTSGLHIPTVVRGQLPFTGLPLWPLLLAALGLVATGMVLRTISGRKGAIR